MALFLSTFKNKTDGKGRVSVPAVYRTAIATQSFQGIVLYRSFTSPCLEGSDLNRMEQLSDATDNLDTFSEEQENLTSLIFADARQFIFDSTGRIMMPQEFLDHAKIKDVACFVGRGKTFQIWNPEIFEKAQLEARENALKNRPTLKLNRKND